MKKRLIFLAVTFTWAWGWWLLYVINGATTKANQGWPTHLLGLLGPLLGAISASWYEGELKSFFERFTRKPGKTEVKVLAATFVLLAFPLYSAIKEGNLANFLAYSGAPQGHNFITIIAIIFYILVVNGFGEEGGWRGYLLDDLLKKRSLGVSALLVWGIWGVWHLPLFFLVANFKGMGWGAIGWALGLGAGSFFLAWLYKQSKSVPSVALWHTMFNFSSATIAANGLGAALSSTLVMIIVGVILFKRSTWKRPLPA